MYLGRGVVTGVVAMSVVVVASNFLVQHPINDWLTYGAFTYPVAFLITDLCNRALGPAQARRVVYAGFAIAVVLSIYFATPRIAIASGTAFMIAQLVDISIFNRLRGGVWWRAPLVSSTVASAVDTVLFFGIAFAATEVPWVTLGIGDYAAKLFVAAMMLIPFRLMLGLTRPGVASTAQH
jgi:uncharacterized PurR-regulated membrane protein YhhQ (DUF165 family)